MNKAKISVAVVILFITSFTSYSSVLSGADTLFQSTDTAAYLGPQNAPVTIIQFSDFQCPFCARVLPVAKRILKEYPEQVKWVFKHYPLPFHTEAHSAHEAVLAAGEQGKFWEMHDLIFSNQDKMKKSHIMEYAGQLNLNTGLFTSSLDSGKYKSLIANDIEEGMSLGVRGVPAFFINWTRFDGLVSFETFKSAIDLELADIASHEQETGFKLTPLTTEITNSPVKGPKGAPITIVEFSDFNSSLCAKAAEQVDYIIKKYEGKVNWVFKNNPQDVDAVHKAAIAAGEQGKFWELHDFIFKDRVENDNDCISYSFQLGLDMDLFMKDLNSTKPQTIIDKDRALGEKLGVSDKPTFFINGRKLVGEQSPSSLENMIKGELARLEKTMIALGHTFRQNSGKVAGKTQRDPLKVMVFSDFQNPDSARTANLLKSIQSAYPDRLRILFKHFPMESGPESNLAHRAALAAEEQGKFWEMHDLIFAGPRKLDRDQLVTYATTLKLDMRRFVKALDGRLYNSLLSNYIKQGKRLQVSSVPTIFINDKRVENISLSIESLKSLLESRLNKERACQG